MDAIARLLSHHSTAINSLSTEESESLSQIRSQIKSGLVGDVISSIREYIQLHPKIKQEIVPGTVGSYLVGCIAGDMEVVCENEEENVYLIEDGEIKTIYDNKSNIASLYYPHKIIDLTPSQVKFFEDKGINRLSHYVISQPNKQIKKEESGIPMEMIAFILFCIVLALSIYFVYPIIMQDK